MTLDRECAEAKADEPKPVVPDEDIITVKFDSKQIRDLGETLKTLEVEFTGATKAAEAVRGATRHRAQTRVVQMGSASGNNLFTLVELPSFS